MILIKSNFDHPWADPNMTPGPLDPFQGPKIFDSGQKYYCRIYSEVFILVSRDARILCLGPPLICQMYVYTVFPSPCLCVFGSTISVGTKSVGGEKIMRR